MGGEGGRAHSSVAAKCTASVLALIRAPTPPPITALIERALIPLHLTCHLLLHAAAPISARLAAAPCTPGRLCARCGRDG